MGDITDGPSGFYAQIRVTNNGSRYVVVEWLNEHENDSYIATRMIDTRTMGWGGDWFIQLSTSDLYANDPHRMATGSVLADNAYHQLRIQIESYTDKKLLAIYDDTTKKLVGNITIPNL